ncbi:MAG: SEC-C domain-containing protein [Gammaproteobacteria bacterium]|nr:SEC-C domain-containing protein [Gammaproteobacteria bacterium]
MSISRNQPCPCDSGKRYKHCCGARGDAPPTAPAPTAAIELRLIMQRAMAHQTQGSAGWP